MSWIMFYSAHMSIRHLASLDVWGDARRAQHNHVLRTRLQREWSEESDSGGSVCMAEILEARLGRCIPDVLKLAPAGSICGGEFCLFCHVFTLAEWEAPSSTGPCGLSLKPSEKKAGHELLKASGRSAYGIIAETSGDTTLSVPFDPTPVAT
jgi:hypothetical protein